jgi:hypothetical protein
MKDMTLRSAYLALALGIGGSSLIASDFDRELERATSQYHKSIAEATASIDQRYKDTLEQLLTKATQAKDLEAAVKIKNTLAGMTGKVVVGIWSRDNTGSVMNFTEGGNYKVSWSGGEGEGRWRAMSRLDVEVTEKSGRVSKFRVSEDGRSIARLSDGMVWVRKS